MTAITIDQDKAIELLEKQVEKKGEDYVYPYDSCIYFATGDEENTSTGETPESGTPLCILGNVYADLGLTEGDLRVHDYTGAWSPGQDGAIGEAFADVLPDPGKVELTDGAIEVFRAAQEVQDHHYPWGKALEAAKEAVA